MPGSDARNRFCVAVSLLAAGLLLAGAAEAGPGFIESSSVTRGTVYSEISIRFRCKSQLLGYDPSGKSDIVRISIQPTTVCLGVPPTVALSREVLRPPGAEAVALDSIEYDGQSQGQESVRLNFDREVTVDVRPGADGSGIDIRVFMSPEATPPAHARTVAGAGSRLVDRNSVAETRYVINLESSTDRRALATASGVDIGPDRELFVSQIDVDGETWYRLRVGYFPSADVAAAELARYRDAYPGAWIDQARMSEDASPVAAAAPATLPSSPQAAQGPGADDAEVAELMREARRAMTAGELSRAIQLYTKVLRQPASSSHPDAQEYLALARERNGQLAHAKAEYEAYLQNYPDGAGADRVRQRLAALLAGPVVAAAEAGRAVPGENPSPARTARQAPAAWKLNTYFSQYYRRDVNQLNDQNEIVSQSSIYTDGSVDARRRGERFDISARLTGGYRTDLLSEEDGGQGNDFRLSYAYVDLLDTGTRVTGRLGRQTRNSGGVLGRFDGINLRYDLTGRIELQAVAGVPVYSTTHGDVVDRRFSGLSATYGPIRENLDVSAFYIRQEVEGYTDRQAIGAEGRYFAPDKTLWAMLDYDVDFSEISSAFLQASWRLPANLSISGLLDHRRSPYLSLGNALVGQPDQDFDALARAFTEEQIRQLALDRSAAATTVTLGLNRPMTPKLQLGINATQSVVEATPESGGVAPMPESEYRYYSLDLVASSLVREGDVTIVNLRQSSTGTTDIVSVNVDARLPVGRTWRVGPRLRVDRRQIRADDSTEWIYSPGIRLQYHPLRKVRFELTAGKEFSSREMAQSDLDRESYFVYLGYQWFQ